MPVRVLLISEGGRLRIVIIAILSGGQQWNAKDDKYTRLRWRAGAAHASALQGACSVVAGKFPELDGRL